jgi:hypothetical protein
MITSLERFEPVAQSIVEEEVKKKAGEYSSGKEVEE